MCIRVGTRRPIRKHLNAQTWKKNRLRTIGHYSPAELIEQKQTERGMKERKTNRLGWLYWFIQGRCLVGNSGMWFPGDRRVEPSACSGPCLARSPAGIGAPSLGTRAIFARALRTARASVSVRPRSVASSTRVLRCGSPIGPLCSPDCSLSTRESGSDSQPCQAYP